MQHHALEENECLVVDEGFPSEDPETTASELRGLMRFAGETTRRQGRALGGCNNITPLEENECLVVDEGFPVDEARVPV
jgi:hypothetical protein